VKRCAYLTMTDPGNFLLVEMIEPSLYLRTGDGAAGRFAAAINKHFEECNQ